MPKSAAVEKSVFPASWTDLVALQHRLAKRKSQRGGSKLGIIERLLGDFFESWKAVIPGRLRPHVSFIDVNGQSVLVEEFLAPEARKTTETKMGNDLAPPHRPRIRDQRVIFLKDALQAKCPECGSMHPILEWYREGEPHGEIWTRRRYVLCSRRSRTPKLFIIREEKSPNWV